MLSQRELQAPAVEELFGLAERIGRGGRVPGWLEPTDDLTPEYRERIIFHLRKHGLMETGGGPAFFHMIPFVPHAQAAEHLCHIAAEELGHGRLNLEPLRDLGLDPDEIFQSRWSMTAEQERKQINLGARPSMGMTGFGDVLGFTMMFDPMGILVVGERVKSNYGPWSRANAQVLREERGHAAFWERWGMDFIQSEEGQRQVQRYIDAMFPQARLPGPAR